MAFKFHINGKDLPANTKIRWKFTTHPTEFESDPDKLVPNTTFWKNRLGLPADAAYEILNAEIKQEDDVNTIINEPHVESHNESNDSQSTEEPMVSEDSTDSIDTAKPKRKRKTV